MFSDAYILQYYLYILYYRNIKEKSLKSNENYQNGRKFYNQHKHNYVVYVLLVSWSQSSSSWEEIGRLSFCNDQPLLTISALVTLLSTSLSKSDESSCWWVSLPLLVAFLPIQKFYDLFIVQVFHLPGKNFQNILLITFYQDFIVHGNVFLLNISPMLSCKEGILSLYKIFVWV